jgi:phage terminase large subunit-like protein
MGEPLVERAPANDWPEWLRRANDLGWTWAVKGWSTAALQPGAWFDHAKADRVVERWPHWFCLTEDRFYGKPFRLVFWQEVVVRLLVGWKMPVEVLDEETGNQVWVHVRVFRQLRLWIPRKNGKSEFLAALALLFFVYERVFGAQGFVFAKDEKQATVPFDKMKTMIGLSPDLGKQVQLYKKSFYIASSRSKFVLLTGRAEGKHGRSPTVYVGDEMHEWLSTLLLDTLRQGTGARLQPIGLCASTAGLKSNATGIGLWDESLAVLDGRSEDPETLVVMFAADEDDDPFDEEVWKKANPSLGLSPTLHFLRSEAAKAKGNPRKESHFRCYHLNQWVDQEVRWLPLTKWDACAPNRNAWKYRLQEMRGHRCTLTLDVSATQDITALYYRFDPITPGGPPLIACRAWLPEATLEKRKKEGREPWDRWLESGAIEMTPGDAVDQDFVKLAIEEAMDDFGVDKIGFDPWNARKLVADLIKGGVGEEIFVEMRQGILTLGEGSKEFERRVFEGSIDHGGHPLMRWMAGHVVIVFDENLNFRPSKKRSREKIDLIVCAVMAEALSIQPVEISGSGIVDY